MLADEEAPAEETAPRPKSLGKAEPWNVVQLWPPYCGTKVIRVGEGTEEGGQGAGQVIDMKVEVTEDDNRKKRENENQEAVGT